MPCGRHWDEQPEGRQRKADLDERALCCLFLGHGDQTANIKLTVPQV